MSLKKDDDIKNVLITTSPFTTLLYFLVNDLDSIKNTAYFFIRTYVPYSTEEKHKIKKIFPHSEFFYENWANINIRFQNFLILRKINTFFELLFKRFIPSEWLTLTKNFRWPFLKNAQIWAYDDWRTSKALIGNRDYIFLDEGLGLYKNAERKFNQSFKQLGLMVTLRGFLDTISTGKTLGVTKHAKKIILAGLAETPKVYEGRNVEVVSMRKLWNESDTEKQNLILNFFDVTNEEIEQLRKRDVIFVEQPLSDDGFMTRDEQIIMIRKIIENYDSPRVVIKKHYRSTMNYHDIFPDVFVMDKPIPMELLSVFGINFTRAITVNSTAIAIFPEDVYIEWLADDLTNPCFSHFSEETRKIFDEFSKNVIIPERVKRQKESGK